MQYVTVRAPIGRSSGRSTLHQVDAPSGQEWQYEISTVGAHIGRSPGQEWQYDISTIRAHIGRSTSR